MKLQKIRVLACRNNAAARALNPGWKEREPVEISGHDAGPEDAAMSEKGDAAKAVTRNLHAAIERVREDVAKVEFWADAVTGFTQPVPEYKSSDVKIWLPAEQAKSLDSKRVAKRDDSSANNTLGDKNKS